MRLRFMLALALFTGLACAKAELRLEHGWNLLNPEVSPDGGTVAFELYNGIWTVPIGGGGEAVQLTAGKQADSGPRWVPGMERTISYSSLREGARGLYYHNLDTGAEQPVPHMQRDFGSYDWLPDGKSLVLAAGRQLLHLDLGSGKTAVVVDSAVGRVSSVDCSPDGRRIVYTTNRRVGYQESLDEMHCVSLDGERSVNLTGHGVEHYSPVWSPEGDKVAFVNYDAGTEDIYLIQFDPETWEFGEPQRLTDDPAEESGPVWISENELLINCNRPGRAALYRADAASGRLTEIPVTSLDFSGPTGYLSLTVTDRASGETVAARVHLATADGRAYYPAHSYPRQNTMGDRSDFFHTTGSFTMELPVGEIALDVVRGFEYEAESRSVIIPAGGTVELEVVLERWVDMGGQGWYSADNHFHANYGGPFLMKPEDVMLMLRAEDLNIGNMVAGNASAGRIYDLEYFSGGMHPLSSDRYLLRWGEEYRSTAYGHMVLMNLEEFIYPQMTGFTLSDYPEDYPPNLDAITAAHKQGGTAHYTHPRSQEPPKWGDYDAFELPVDLALGGLDAMDIACLWSSELLSSKLYYRLLNCGFKMAVSAGTDVFTSRVNPAPGADRVYAHAGSPLDYAAWIEAFRGGRTFVTNGPMMWFTVNGEEPGSSLDLESNGATVTVEVTARSVAPIDSLEIIVNGEAVRKVEAVGDGREVSLSVELPLTESCWIAARALGPGHRLVLDTHLFAHTSPVYVYLDSEPISSAGDAEYFIWWIDEVLKRVDARDRWTADEHKWRIHELFRLARQYYERMAGN
ncbi:MAG: hypothetical protein FVQ81_08065 [Candidatus Glassbacteria bacterium]|nr:hypothetical protein [Candidatus Glassbacteria bacterium]